MLSNWIVSKNSIVKFLFYAMSVLGIKSLIINYM